MATPFRHGGLTVPGSSAVRSTSKSPAPGPGGRHIAGSSAVRSTSKSPAPGPGGRRSSSRGPSPGPERRTASPGPARPATSPARLVGPQDVTQVFKRFDVNGDGGIDLYEMRAVLQELDPVYWTDKNASLLLMAVDKNFDGKVDYSEFVEWVSAEGSTQEDFRTRMNMPRSRADLAKFEKERAQAALRGTVEGLESDKKLLAHRLECVQSAEKRRDEAHEIYNKAKDVAENASQIFMPMYDRFRQCSADIPIPAQEILAIAIKDVSAEVSTDDLGDTAVKLPRSIELTAQGMCVLFKVHPGKNSNREPDYWTAFLEVVLTPKLFTQMEQFDKENIPKVAADEIAKLCSDEDFDPDVVKAAAKTMQHASFIVSLCLWMHFLHKYRQAGVKKLWDRVHQNELQMNKEIEEVKVKGEALRVIRRHVKMQEDTMNALND